MMRDSTQAVGEMVELEITREEAKLIREALKVLCNCRRYSFKDEHDRIDELHDDLFAGSARIEERLRDALSAK